MNVNGDDPYGHTMPELRHSDVARALRAIELERDRRQGLVPTKRRQRKSDLNISALHAAFVRAAREERELQRLKASGKPFACLEFNPA